MPRTVRKPAYTLHRPSGQARVRIDRVDHYLGPFNSDESRARYEDLTARWAEKKNPTPAESLSIDELAIRYMQHVRLHYRKNGEPTSEVHLIQLALRPLLRLYGPTLAMSFGPKKLRLVRDDMIGSQWVRKSINIHVGRIRRMFRWATSEELLPDATVFERLKTLPGLEVGRTNAIESKPVQPVPEAFIEAVKPFVSRQIWGMIRLQLATGMRPGEVLIMRGCDLNTSGKVWEYVPTAHKTEHHGRGRMVFLGPQAQDVVKEFLKTDLRSFLFSPAESVAAFVGANYRQGAARKRVGKRTPKERYSIHTYHRAVVRACERAGVPVWHPHRLRHNAATKLRREFGLDTARTVLGHSSMAVTEVYAEQDLAKARDAAAKIG